MSNVILRPLAQCPREMQMHVRDIRNQPTIRHNMYSDHEIGLEEHQGWLDWIVRDSRQQPYCILVDDRLSGLISLTDIDWHHATSDWAFYLDEQTRGGLGAALEYHFLNHAFDQVKLQKLNCAVLETNAAVIKLHTKFGFIDEGFRRAQILRDGNRIGVQLLGLTADEWQDRRDQVLDTYRSLLDKFDLTIEPDLPPTA